MQPDGKFADALRVVTYGTLGLVFLIAGSHDGAAEWMQWVMGAIFFVGIGYCAFGRREKWKLILGLLPGMVVVLLFLVWVSIRLTSASSINMGTQFSVQSTQDSLILKETRAGGTVPLMANLPYWFRELLRIDYVTENQLLPATVNTPNAFQIAKGMPNSGMTWVVYIYTSWATVTFPIWSPMTIIGIPTVFWALVILISWIVNRSRPEAKRAGQLR